MVKPSPIVESLPRSGIREIMELAWTVPDVIHLEVGEPNFDTPAHVVEAAHRAARDGFTRYTPNAGIPELREVLAEKVRNRNHIEAEADRIVVTPGAVVGIYSTLAAAAEAGSEMLLSDPAWPNYQLMTRLLGVNSVRYPLAEEDDFIPNAARIEPHITDRTKVLLLNSPGNPTGATTPKEALMELMELAKTYDLWVLSDEVYDEIWFDSPHVSAGPFDPDGRVVTFFSFSKTYAMTGWRVGYLVAPPALAESVIKAQEPISSCVNAPAQKAAVEAITGPQEMVAEMRNAYRRRRDLVVELLEKEGIAHVRPTGAFYLMAEVSRSGLSGYDFARRLVLERGVAVVPGNTFGPTGDKYVRLSLATATDPLIEGVTRLAQAINEWGTNR
ncbi:MAG: pyridoxal phosphate-dependent aminotransferase [Acidimicrobiia bacterium]|nr:pyridoxal phosphate-dependent aminotransferase [Acidimicrobiia bacterium]